MCLTVAWNNMASSALSMSRITVRHAMVRLNAVFTQKFTYWNKLSVKCTLLILSKDRTVRDALLAVLLRQGSHIFPNTKFQVFSRFVVLNSSFFQVFCAKFQVLSHKC